MEEKTQIAVPRQFPLALESSLLRDLAPTQRAKVVSLLAPLLLEAGGEVDMEEDDERF